MGKSAPPRPRRPLRSTSSISWWGGRCGSGAVDAGVGGQRHRAAARLKTGEQPRKRLMPSFPSAHDLAGEPDSVPVTVSFGVSI